MAFDPTKYQKGPERYNRPQSEVDLNSLFRDIMLLGYFGGTPLDFIFQDQKSSENDIPEKDIIEVTDFVVLDN